MPNPVPLLSSVTRVVRPMFRGLAIASSGLSAERFRMEIAAQNIANAETVDSQGHAYQRQVAVLAPGTQATVDGGAGNMTMGGGNDAFGGVRAGVLPGMGAMGSVGGGGDVARAFGVPVLQDLEAQGTSGAGGPGDGLYGVAVQGAAVDTAPGAMVYDPGNPAANAQGYVQSPNVNITEETVNLMEARRAYEANASVFQAIKASLNKALEI